MKYRTSFFNPTLAKNLLHRYWPAILGATALWLLVFLSALSGNLQMIKGADSSVINETISGLASIAVICYLPAAMLGAALCFHHIHNRTELQFYHALPIRRRCIYSTVVITGYVCLLLPFVMTLLAGLLLAIPYGASVRPFLLLAGAGAATLCIDYGMAVLCCVLAGQLVGAILLYFGMHCFLIFMAEGIMTLTREFLLGFNGTLVPNVIEWLTPVSGLSVAMNTQIENGRVVFANHTAILLYALVGIVLLLLGGIAYRVRRGENAGDMLAFQWLKLPAKICGAAAVTMGALMLSRIFDYRVASDFPLTLVCSLLFGVIGWFAAEMIVRKTIRVFQARSCLYCAAFLCVVLMTIAGIRFDPLGVENRIPSADRLENTALVYLGANDAKKVSVEEARALHALLLDHKELLEAGNDGEYRHRISILYTEKTGMPIEREYYLLSDPDGDDTTEINRALMDILGDGLEAQYSSYGVSLPVEQMEALCTSAVLCTEVTEYYDDQKADFTKESYFAFPGGTLTVSAEEAIVLYAAARKDVEAGCHLFDDPYEIPYGTIQFNRAVDAAGEEQTCDIVRITQSMNNTLQMLGALGYPLQMK